MASRPPGGGQQAAPSDHGGPLLDLEYSNPVYNNGRPPSVNDEELLHQYDIDSSERPQPRPSISYDAFVGAQQSTHGLPGGPGAPHTGNAQRPYLSVENGRTYSQTSELNNYQRYSDMDDLPDDDRSMQGGYYHTDGPVEGGPSRMVSGRGHRSRNSVLSMGGGLMGKAKSMFGMSPGYSEMDMPLRKTASGQPRMNSDMTEEHVKKPGHKRLDLGNFKFGLGRGKPDPSSLGPRIIHLNNPPANSQNRYLDNHVSTAKYNIATFLPKFLFEQFSKYANLFFLFTAALQQIPNISPTNRYTTIGPLIIVLLVSAGKELIEDFKRKNSDKSLNHSKARVLKGSSFENQRWVSVKVGDVVRVESEEPFPADLVLLASSEPEGLCYIETANLDGETNLKIKQAIPETANLVSPSELSRLSGRVRSEQPNSSLYTYEATLTMTAGGGEKELPLAPDQLLLRGATLRNTPWIHGIVVFTGHETKLMRNATATPIKRTHVERMVNIQILMLVAVLVALSIVSSVGDLIVRATAHSKLSYLYIEDTSVAKQFFSDIFTYWVLYSNLVPISLFVTIEVVKYYQAFLINSDLDMYYDRTDTAAICRTSSLVEELGQIEYIFSDKTGTLTCNMMEFKQCSIGGIQYADEIPEDRRATEQNPIGIYDFRTLRENLRKHQSQTEIHHFLALLSTCHTVIPERRDEKPSEIKYQAASPDEGALVEGAVMLGYQFTARRPRSVTITVEGEDYEYELLAVLEFNSTRKRMSTIFRCPDGKVRCYCKGADTVILERLGKNNPNVEATLQHLEEYATEGLRTLCLAMREIPEPELQQWLQIFDKANTTVSGNRPEELDKAAEIIEHDFSLLGATAIEDKLQDGVPDTIHTLQEAGIKVWVLTGDRQETAINIGMSCKLISEDMTLLIVNEENSDATRTNLGNKLSAIRNQSAGGAELETLALVIDGKSLTFALERDMEKMFLELAIMCKAVICCRVSPLQKALVVKLVKRNLKAILLAIGDGANDVSMIQAAHVGVGISGVEGLQAARSADVAIGQFRYLRKLLLVHGAWSYQRISKLILYSFYKNIALYMTQFWYSFQNGFSGEVIFESWTLSFYNVFFTVFPPFVIGIFDQFISARLLDRYPQLYQLGQKGVFFKMHSFWSWILNGFYHSLLSYFISELIWFWDLPQSDGKVAGHWVWGTALYTAVLATVLGKAALITNIWTKYTFLAIPGSMVIWLAFIAVYATVAPKLGFSTEYDGVVPRLFESPVFYLMGIVVPVICLLRDFAWKYGKRMYRPQTYHHVQEIQKYNIQDYRPRMEQFQKAIRKVRQVQRMRKQRGYAFSQADESQNRVLQAYDTTKERGRYGEMSCIIDRSASTPLRSLFIITHNVEFPLHKLGIVDVLFADTLFESPSRLFAVDYPTLRALIKRLKTRMGLPEVTKAVRTRAIACHGHIPGLRKLPFPAVGIIVGLIIANVLVWVAVAVVLHYHAALISTAILSYTLGLRHALDADHISAIDLMTRRLVASGQRPVTVGSCFSLGHSTIVVITSIVVAATASAISSKFVAFSKIGSIVGTSVSAAFLILLGVMNIYILYKLIGQLMTLIDTAPGEEEHFEIKGAGCLFYLFKKMFKLIDKPWKMYPLGVMFGLGFDTSSEVALLGIASIQGAKGTSIWLILIFPILFTAGMCLLDTIDGALMMALYTSTAMAKDRIAILYYSIVLTIITVAVAMAIGFIQMLSLIQNVAHPTGKFWEGVVVAGDHYDIIGGAICCSFVVFGALSVLIYKPWRRRIDRRRQARQQPQKLQQNEELAIISETREPSDWKWTQPDQEAQISSRPENASKPNHDTISRHTL